MPKLDKTGPTSQGKETGRGLGPCGEGLGRGRRSCGQGKGMRRQVNLDQVGKEVREEKSE